MDAIREKTEALCEARRQLWHARTNAKYADEDFGLAHEALGRLRDQRAEIKTQIVDHASTIGARDVVLTDLVKDLRANLVRSQDADRLVSEKTAAQSKAHEELRQADKAYTRAKDALIDACLEHYNEESVHD